MANLGIALQFPTPPLDLTHQEALPGNPYPAGNHTFDRVRGPINLDAFGIYWEVHTWPAGIGSAAPGTTTIFDRRVLQLMQVKEDILSVVQNGPFMFTDHQQGIMMFDEFPILRVAAWIYPGVTVNFHWVVVF